MHRTDHCATFLFKPGMRCRLHSLQQSHQFSEVTRNMDISSQSIVEQAHTRTPALLSPPRPERSGVLSPAVVESATQTVAESEPLVRWAMFGMLNICRSLALTKRYVWPLKPIIALFGIDQFLPEPWSWLKLWNGGICESVLENSTIA